MRISKLAKAFGYLDDDLIAEAARGARAKKRDKRLLWIACAACLALLAYSGVRLTDGISRHTTERPSDLPMLAVSNDTGSTMGFEGYMAYDIAELSDANPWSGDAALPTLPVFENPLSWDENSIVSGADFEKMEVFLREIAARLGLDADSLEIRDDTPDAAQQEAIAEKMDGDVPKGYFNPTSLIAEADGLRLEVDVSMTAEITFEPAVTLPPEYHFNWHSTYEEMYRTAEYLLETWRDLIGMENPQIHISGGDYNIYLKREYRIEFYDAASDLTESILNYNFNRTAFYCDDDGRLSMVRFYQPDLTKKPGDYPIISPKEAGELLLNGNYITSVPHALPGAEYIAKTELIYRTGRREKYYMPYYRFYVELPGEEREGGLKTYGAYYVPAVQQAYIENMPVWDGSFNY